MKIDLHIHSTFSDGTYTPSEIVRVAKEKKLGLIALTDHNTIDGFEVFKKALAMYEQDGVLGVEISTYYKKKEIHLLSYFPTYTNFNEDKYRKLLDFVEYYHAGKVPQIEGIVNNLSKDLDVSLDEFYAFIDSIKDNHNLNRVHIANYLMNKEIVSSIDEGFKKYLREDSKYYVGRELVDLLESIKIVRECGGIPTIAHLGQYKYKEDEIKELFLDIKDVTNEIGVELFHYDHDPEDVRGFLTILEELIEEDKFNIFYTAGSDFHGKNKPNKIGEPFNYKNGALEGLYEAIGYSFIYSLREKGWIKEH